MLSLDEFRRLCAEKRVELSEAEVAAAFDLLDTGVWVPWGQGQGQGQGQVFKKGSLRAVAVCGGGSWMGSVTSALLACLIGWLFVYGCPMRADKSGTLDFGEWVAWWLQKKDGGGAAQAPSASVVEERAEQ